VSVVLSWNVQGRVRTVSAQAAALAEQPADVVALQEVRVTSMEAWRHELGALGYQHVRTTLDEHDPLVRLPPDRRLGVLVATRAGEVEPLPSPEVPWPERLLVARVEIDGEPAELCNLHSPISSKADEVKVRTLEAVTAYLAEPSDLPRILVGDLNTPQYESREGEVSSFARTRSGRLRPDYGERHDQAELGIVVGLTEHGYRDAFRTLHGYLRRDRSWLYPNGKMGYRLDHILARSLEIEACDYRHDWRGRRLSDHAAIWASLRQFLPGD
jgi:endonuclease/exonuclease/phosphatase family metal-dependent hydrolase